MRDREHPLSRACRADATFVGTLGITALTIVLLGAAALTRSVRGSSWEMTAIAVTVLLATGSLTVITARFSALGAEEANSKCIALGLSGAGLVVVGGAVARSVLTHNGFGWLDMIVSIAALLLIALSIPAARQLATGGRLRRLANRIADPDVPLIPRRSASRGFVFVAACAGLVLVVIGLIWILPSGPFGHDESVYALKARSWASGTPDTGFEIYRPVGMPIIGWLVLQISSTETAFRSAAIVLSTVTIGVLWLGGRVVFEAVSTTLATAVFVTAASFLRRSTEFLNDVSSAGLLFAAAVVIWYQFERRPTSWWIVLAAPLGVTAYYMRYGSALTLGVIVVVALVVWRDRLLAALPQLAATTLVAMLCLVPHAIYAIDVAGSPWGIFRSATTSVGGGGGGLADYASWLPNHLAGRLGFLLIAAAFTYAITTAAAAARRGGPWIREARTTGFFVGTAVLTTLGLGAFTHGEPRFVFFPIMATLLVGARALHIALRSLRHPLTNIVAACCAAALIVSYAAGVTRMSRGMDAITGRRTVIAQAGRAINADAGGESCEVRSTYQPQLTWYSMCATHQFSHPLPTVDPSYLVLFANETRQPVGDARDAEIANTDQIPLVEIPDLNDGPGMAVVFRYRSGR